MLIGKILAFDIGNSYGWCFKNGEDEESGHGECNDLMSWASAIKDHLKEWKPDILVLSQTNNFGNWSPTRAMLLKAGVAFYLAGKSGIPGVELNDSSARKAVFGKAIKKKEAQAMFPNYQPDELDATILARGWHELSKNT